MQFKDDENKILLSWQAFKKIRYYTSLVEDEIFGMLIIINRGPHLVVKDVLLPDQVISGASCNPTPQGMARVLAEAGDDVEHLRGWFHSHSTMQTFYSTTDRQTIHNMGEGSPFVISIVSNRQGELLSRVDFFTPFRFKLDMNLDLDWNDPDIMAECQQMVRERVKKQGVVHRNQWQQQGHQHRSHRNPNIAPNTTGVQSFQQHGKRTTGDNRINAQNHGWDTVYDPITGTWLSVAAINNRTTQQSLPEIVTGDKTPVDAIEEGNALSKKMQKAIADKTNTKPLIPENAVLTNKTPKESDETDNEEEQPVVVPVE
jgi:hypothetical protein